MRYPNSESEVAFRGVRLLVQDEFTQSCVSAADQRGFCERQNDKIVGQGGGPLFSPAFTLELKPPASNAA